MAPPSLQFDQSILPFDSLELEANVDRSGLEVHVRPSKSKCFALSQAERECDRVQRFKPVALGCLKQYPSLGRRERRDLVMRDPRWIHEHGDVAPNIARLQC